MSTCNYNEKQGADYEIEISVEFLNGRNAVYTRANAYMDEIQPYSRYAEPKSITICKYFVGCELHGLYKDEKFVYYFGDGQIKMVLGEPYDEELL